METLIAIVVVLYLLGTSPSRAQSASQGTGGGDPFAGMVGGSGSGGSTGNAGGYVVSYCPDGSPIVPGRPCASELGPPVFGPPPTD